MSEMSADLLVLLPEPWVVGQPPAAGGLQPQRAGLLCAGGLPGHQARPETADTARSDLSAGSLTHPGSPPLHRHPGQRRHHHRPRDLRPEHLRPPEGERDEEPGDVGGGAGEVPVLWSDGRVRLRALAASPA